MKIEFDNTIAVITPETEAEAEMYMMVRDAAKSMAPGARYMYKYKLWQQTGGAKGWDGRTSILSRPHPVKKYAWFPTGMLPYIYNELMELMPNATVSITDRRVTPSKVTPGPYTVPLRPYQVAAFNAATRNQIVLGGVAFDWPCGVLQIATGGGKTEIAVAMYQSRPVSTMFVVHRKHLMSQAKNRFAKYGIQAGQIGDSVFSPSTSINVATVQTLHNLLKAGDMEKINSFIKSQQIIFDEAHLCASKIDKGNQFVKLAQQFRHAYFRYGLTATPFMRDQYSNQLLMGCTGGKLCEISNDTLIKAGYLTPPRVRIIEVPPLKVPGQWPDCYDRGVILNDWRNNRIVEELRIAPKPAIVMTTRLAHAKVLAKSAERKGIICPAEPVQGATSNRDRLSTITKLQNSELEAIITTTIFDEGVDLPELRTLILAGGGKSTVAQLQRIGRGLRKAAGKHEVLVIDFKDQSGGVLKRHSALRRKVWLEQGFFVEEGR